MSDSVLVKQDLLLKLAQLLRYLIEVNDAVIDGLLISVILTDPQTFRDGL